MSKKWHLSDSRPTSRFVMAKAVKQVFFLGGGVLFIKFSNSTHDTYSCKGTSGKKLVKPPWGDFSKKHCREFIHKSNFYLRVLNKILTMKYTYLKLLT